MSDQTPQPPRGSAFRSFAQQNNLSDRQIAYARSAGVRNAADFYSFLRASPDIAVKESFDTPHLTDLLLQEGAVAHMIQRNQLRDPAKTVWFGATAPPGATFQVGQSAPDLTDQEVAQLASFEVGPLAGQAAVGVTTCDPWPVRDQEQRGTCVSFATTAAYELYLCALGENWQDLSEQFLYWAIKNHALDGIPNQDGTWHEFAVEALQEFGICAEEVWPYDPNPGPTVSHHPPPANAETLAGALRTQQPRATAYNQISGKAQMLLDKLHEHNGVAIALPVFDAPGGGIHNWGTFITQNYGEVMNPVAGWTTGGGHAVCCVGFVPDEEEPLGGHFIIRNSWGTELFGSELPDPEYVGPEPGYGQVSASYIDRYLWEDCTF